MTSKRADKGEGAGQEDPERGETPDRQVRLVGVRLSGQEDPESENTQDLMALTRIYGNSLWGQARNAGKNHYPPVAVNSMSSKAHDLSSESNYLLDVCS